MILTIGYRKRETDIRAITSWNSRDSFATSVARVQAYRSKRVYRVKRMIHFSSARKKTMAKANQTKYNQSNLTLSIEFDSTIPYLRFMIRT